MEFESKELAHYGLVKAVIDRTKMTERMGQILPKKERHHILRKGLGSTKQTIKTFSNKKIKNPTFAMVVKLLRRVQILKIKVNGKIYRKILDLDDDLIKVINIFGPSAQKIYGFP